MKKIIGTIKFGSQKVLLHIEDEELAEFVQHEYIINKKITSLKSHKMQIYVLSDEHLTEYLVKEGGIPTRRIKLDINVSVNIKEFILQGLIELCLSKKGFYFMHGSSYLRNKNLFVFLGPSGSGKTTILKLLNPKNIISNDTVVLRRSNKKILSLYRSPFDARSVFKQSSKKISIKNIQFYKLTKNKINTISELKFHEKIELLIENMNLHMFAMQTNIASVHSLKIVCQKQAVKNVLTLSNSSKIYNLSFNLDLSSGVFSNISKHE